MSFLRLLGFLGLGNYGVTNIFTEMGALDGTLWQINWGPWKILVFLYKKSIILLFRANHAINNCQFLDKNILCDKVPSWFLILQRLKIWNKFSLNTQFCFTSPELRLNMSDKYSFFSTPKSYLRSFRGFAVKYSRVLRSSAKFKITLLWLSSWRRVNGRWR